MPYRLLTCANPDATGEQSLRAEGDDLEALNVQAHALGVATDERPAAACVIERADGGATEVVGIYPIRTAPEQQP